MGLGPSKIYENFYVGSLRDGTDPKKLEENGITHIVSILSSMQYKKSDKSEKYKTSTLDEKYKRLRISIEDKTSSDLTPYFKSVAIFIHKALFEENGVVLIHCAQGKSRSVTLCCAYICSLTLVDWKSALNAIRHSRPLADPNPAFKEQLRLYQENGNFKNDQKLLDEIYHSDEHVTEIKSTIEENSQNYLKKKRADNESKKQKIEQVYQQCMFFTATKYLFKTNCQEKIS